MPCLRRYDEQAKTREWAGFKEYPVLRYVDRLQRRGGGGGGMCVCTKYVCGNVASR